MRLFLLIAILLPLSLRAQQPFPVEAARAAQDSLGQQPTAATLSAAPAVLAEEPARLAPSSSAPDSLSSARRPLTAPQRYQQGRTAAKQHYRPAKGVFWGAAGTGLVAPLGLPGLALGAGGATAVGLAKPQQARLVASAPEPALLRDPDYYRGYQAQARRQRTGKVVAGFGVGAGTALATLATIIAISLSQMGSMRIM